MTVCKFWQQGRCKYGDNCKFEHPVQSQRQNNGPRNPFGQPPQNQGFGGQHQSQGGRGGGRNDQNRQGDRRRDQERQRFDVRDLPYKLDPKTIRDDLTIELPLWPLSAYGPGRDAPKQLIEGEVEQSPEEMRTLFYLAKLQGNTGTAVQDEQTRAQKAQAQISTILNDLEGACKYIVDGRNQHPNRWDICDARSAPRDERDRRGGNSQFGSRRDNPFNQPQAANPFGAAGPVATSTPSGANPQPSNPFGALPAQPPVNPFNQPPPPQPAAFGRPSMPGQAPAFGQPTPPGPPSAFGQPSMPGQAPAFGRPAAPAPPSAFGQPAMPGQAPAFGQPAMLGQAPAFSQPAAQQPVNPFGQPPPFGQPAQPTPQAQNPFGQKPQANGFVAPPTQPNPFGQPPPATTAQPQLQTSSPFQQAHGNAPANPHSAASNPFGGSTASGPAAVLGAARSASITQPQSLRPNGPLNSAAPTSVPPPRPRGAPKFFDAPPERNPDTEATPEDYGPAGSEKRVVLEQSYQAARATGRFEGDVPEVPPLHGWVGFDF